MATTGTNTAFRLDTASSVGTKMTTRGHRLRWDARRGISFIVGS